jgi:uncharacterized surface protein with fasciclin (FAS1) repeats
MKKLTSALFATCLCAGAAAASEEIRFHGKSVMFSTNSIISNLLASHEHTILMKALRSVGLEQPLLYQGNFTLFAPVDDAFAKLPADFSESLFRRVNRREMARLLACHIVADDRSAGEKLVDQLKPGAPLVLKTLGGCLLKLEAKDGAVFVTDESGNQGKIIEADIRQTNGLIELIDHVFVPKF